MNDDASVIRRLAATRPSLFRKGETLMGVPRGLGPDGLDIAAFGIPYDGGATGRKGAALGPEQIRHGSYNISAYNVATRICPKKLCRVRDIGDTPLDMFDGSRSYEMITDFCHSVCSTGARPLAAGGDHSVTLPLLRAVAARHGPVAVVHFDAHPDTFDDVFGHRYNHATPFRRAIEERLEDPKRHVMIGLRGTTIYPAEHFDWAEAQGITMLGAEACFEMGARKIAELCRETVGNRPVYVTIDVDGLDPADMPGTGSPEPGGLRMRDVQVILRGLRGLNVVGADVVEVFPLLDPTGYTATNAAHLMFELLCVMAESVSGRSPPESKGARA